MQMLTEPMSAPEAFEKWWQALPLRNGEITSDHIRQAWDAAIIFERDECRKLARSFAVEPGDCDAATAEAIAASIACRMLDEARNK